ncbi:MAG: Fic family protein [Alphaproteobacteria bacterium]
MQDRVNKPDFSTAVDYHYGGFPPENVDTARLMDPLAEAAAAIARYDQMLKGLHNSELLLAPLQRQEAVISSRMEGTVSTLDEVLEYEADREDGDMPASATFRQEAIEVHLYAQALRLAQKRMQEGAPLSSFLIKQAHETLLSWGRGAGTSAGQFKTRQNYLADPVRRKILFVPIAPEFLNDGMESLIKYMNDTTREVHVRTAVSHCEFEALHPFEDGNGRIGRMLITLMLWHYKVISAPHFYVSAYFEQNRDEYIDRMREVSRTKEWTDWIAFFLHALQYQANENLRTAERIRNLYEIMKQETHKIYPTKWSTMVLDFLFSRPIFRSDVFPEKTGIPPPTAGKIRRALVDNKMLRTIRPASGRRPALYSFEPLLRILRV